MISAHVESSRACGCPQIQRNGVLDGATTDYGGSTDGAVKVQLIAAETKTLPSGSVA